MCTLSAVLPPLFKYFGSKHRSSKLYPPPKHDLIIEPFAGGAGYSLHYPDRQVVLIEKNKKMASIWRWLIDADPKEILSLPLLEPGEEIPGWVPEPQRWWIGFWCYPGIAEPKKRLNVSCRVVRSDGRDRRSCFWNANIRERSAEAVQRIRHWIILEGDYRLAPDLRATWFIDPPYRKLDHYKRGPLDYAELARWSVMRPGHVIVCEQTGADWLPFQHLANLQATVRNGKAKRANEAICTWDSDDFN